MTLYLHDYDKVLKRTEKFKLKKQKAYNHRLIQQGEVGQNIQTQYNFLQCSHRV